MSSREVRLLLVDDDPMAIQVMGRILAQYRDQRFATSGEAALRLAREMVPDLILLDVDMPGMTGFEVCAALKADPALAHIPVIFATIHNAPRLRTAAMQKGAVDFLSKPLVAEQLTASVRSQLRSKLLIGDPKFEGQAHEPATRPSNEPLPRILIVDDDPASVIVLRHTLQSMGELHFAETGEEALRLAGRLLPDLILLDAHMPGIDGFEVCRYLKADAHLAHMPIAFVTRLSDPRHETRAFELGAADFVAKPYTGAVLRVRVRHLLDLKRRADAEMRAAREHWRRVGDERIADVFGVASDAIVTYDADDNVVLINAAACRMFGIVQEQAIGFPARSLFGDDMSADVRPRSEAARTTMARSNGDTFAVESSFSTFGEGADRLTTVLLRDISDMERIEEESRSRIEAEAAIREKASMMSRIAHEMGNSLNALLGFAELMGADTDQPLTAEQARRLEYIVTCGGHLQGLTRDVMDLGRFETGHPKDWGKG